MSVHSKVKVYGAVVRTRTKSRLSRKPKQESPAWQKRNTARAAIQANYALMVAGAVDNIKGGS
jgi:hypothetical protein